MNKQELIDLMAQKSDNSKAVTEKVFNAFIEIVPSVLKKGDSIRIANFGTWEVVKSAARTGRNPQTGAPIKIPASKRPKFSAGKGLKDALN